MKTEVTVKNILGLILVHLPLPYKRQDQQHSGEGRVYLAGHSRNLEAGMGAAGHTHINIVRKMAQPLTVSQSDRGIFFPIEVPFSHMTLASIS